MLRNTNQHPLLHCKSDLKVSFSQMNRGAFALNWSFDVSFCVPVSTYLLSVTCDSSRRPSCVDFWSYLIPVAGTEKVNRCRH